MQRDSMWFHNSSSSSSSSVFGSDCESWQRRSLTKQTQNYTMEDMLFHTAASQQDGIHSGGLKLLCLFKKRILFVLCCGWDWKNIQFEVQVQSRPAAAVRFRFLHMMFEKQEESRSHLFVSVCLSLTIKPSSEVNHSRFVLKFAPSGWKHLWSELILKTSKIICNLKHRSPLKSSQTWAASVSKTHVYSSHTVAVCGQKARKIPSKWIRL